MLSHPTLWAIRLYQRHLSARKGYGCAYRLAHGGTGCSGFAKGAIAEHGVWQAIPLIQERFRACKVAALNLRRDADEERDEEDDKKKKKKDSHWSDCIDCGYCCSSGRGGSGRSKSSSPDRSGSDCTPDCAPDWCSP